MATRYVEHEVRISEHLLELISGQSPGLIETVILGDHLVIEAHGVTVESVIARVHESESVVSVTHEASFSRMTSDKVTPRLRASRSRRWTTGPDTDTPIRRTSPSGLITLGRAITPTLIGGCCPVGECRQNRPHLYPIARLRGRENESSSELLRVTSPESAS